MSDKVGLSTGIKPGGDKRFVPKPRNGPKPGGARLDSDRVGG
jgi:hypothetical protein